MFILASSVCKSLQCLISTLTQGGRLFRLTCAVLQWEGGALQATIPGVCGECSQCLGHTGFAPTHGVCAFPIYTAQAPGCSAGELSKAGPELRALPRPKPLRFKFSGTPQRHRRLGMHSVPFPGPSSLGDQVHSPRWAVRLTTSPFPAPQVPGCARRASSQVRHVSPLMS